MRLMLLMLLCAAGTAFAQMPSPTMTPGVTLSVTVAQICKRGYAHSVRNVPESEKMKVYHEYGLKGSHDGYCKAKGCEVDHLISLELGGSNDIHNLWPQPYAGQDNAHDKDKVENAAHKAVCSGSLSLEYAQRQIAADWRVLGRQLSLKYHGLYGPGEASNIPHALQAVSLRR